MPADKFKFLKLDEIVHDGVDWLTKTLSSVGANYVGAVTHTNFTTRREFTKDNLAKSLSDVLRIVQRQNEYIVHLEKQAQELKSDMIINQGTVIDLQNELILVKDQQLNVFKTTVVTSVEDTVKSQLKSYSEAVQKTSASVASSLSLDTKTLKNVFKDVVAEEDRTRNFMIFGLPEDEEEQTCEKVSEILMELGEKPRIEATRLGLKTSKDAKQLDRPIKVSVSSTTVVQKILSKSRNLRTSGRYKKVFIKPDRSADQRAEHRALVLELKKRSKVETDKRHFIKDGQLCSVDKVV